MTSKLTREQLLERACENVKALKMASRQTAFGSIRDELLADLQLAEYALTCLEGGSEPVAEIRAYYPLGIDGGEQKFVQVTGELPDFGAQLYRHAQPAPERDQVRREHAEWSQATFGNVGPVGPLKHLSKEALEAAAEPDDLSEWADMQFLLWDAQRRAGITDEQITQAMIEKLAVNKQREWPEPKEGEPRLHIKEQPAPVVLKDHEIRELVNQLRDIAVKYHGAGQLREQIARVIRAAMLQAGNSPAQSDCCPAQNSVSPAQDGNSPVILGWIPVSERMPEENGTYQVWNGKHVGAVPFFFGSFQCLNPEQVTHWMPTPAAPQEVKP